MKIFVSHSSADKSFVHLLRDDLAFHGFPEVWLDEIELHVGDLLTSKLEGAIKLSDRLLLCISPTSASSPWVEFEVNLAITRSTITDGFLIPIIIRPTDASVIKAIIPNVLYADMSTPSTYRAGISRLLRALGRTGVELNNLELNGAHCEVFLQHIATDEMRGWVSGYFAYIAESSQDPTERYWAYHGLKRVGDDRSVAELERFRLRETNGYALRALRSPLRTT